MPTASWSAIPAVRSVLARAYVDDPLMAWIFPDPVLRPQSVAAWLGLFAEAAMASQSVDVVGARAGPEAAHDVVSGVAVWRFPGEPPSRPETLPSVAGLLAALIGSDRAGVVGRGLAALRPLAPTGPSAYVQCLAVDPAARSRGLGRAVLASGLARAAAQGSGVHLETADPGALPFYEALGLHVTGHVDLPGGGPRLWALRLQAPTPTGPDRCVER